MTDATGPRFIDKVVGIVRGADRVTQVNRNWTLFELPGDRLMLKSRNSRAILPVTLDAEDAGDIARAILSAEARREAARAARLSPPPPEGDA